MPEVKKTKTATPAAAVAPVAAPAAATKKAPPTAKAAPPAAAAKAAPATPAKQKAAAPVQPPPDTSAGMWEIPFPPDADFGGGMPEGTFLMQCIDEPKSGLTAKQKPQIIFQMECVDPAAPDYAGKQQRIYCSMEPRAWWFICNLLDKMGVPYEIDKVRLIFKFNRMLCVGKVVKCVFEAGDNGRNRINGILGAEEGVENLSGVATEEAGETVQCPECGADIPADAKSCPNCGVEFVDE
jgi:hypothetical protein